MKIALLGYGKMGKMIEEIIARECKHEVVLRISSSNKHLITPGVLEEADVAIEFSNPASAASNIKECFGAGIPVVAGTTGWMAQLNEIKNECTIKNGSIVYASNFSIGVTLFFELNRKLAQLLKNRPEYIPQLKETHHTQKKDAPSGTAITLANDIINFSASKMKWVNKETSDPQELVIQSERTGEVIGLHSVEYISETDKIEIRHEAFSREGFAKGAILAAELIIGKKGCFEFKELLQPAL